MAMLVWQAVAAHAVWYGAQFDQVQVQALIEEAEAERQVLFGERM